MYVVLDTAYTQQIAFMLFNFAPYKTVYILFI